MAKILPKILFVYADPDLSHFVANILGHLNYEVILTDSIEEAKEKIIQDSFKFIFSEKTLKSGTGLDMLNVARRISPCPFLLLSDSTETRETEGNKMLNFLTLYRPFQEKDLIEAIEQLTNAQEDSTLFLDGGQLVKVEEEFSKIDIQEFISGREIKYDIFISLGSTKFVKLSHGDDVLSRDQIERLKHKGVGHLYMRKQDFISYISITVDLIKQMPKSKIPADRKSQFIQQTSKILSESILLQDRETEAIFHAKDVVDATINMLVGCDEILLSLELLKSGCKSTFSHSLNAALFSVMTARKLKWNSYLTQVKLAAGGMFHDIGKAKLPPDLLVIPPEELNEGELKMMEDHVILGVGILKNIKSIPPEVVSIVLQHHEEESGKGYPQRLTRSSMLALARVVKLSDDFCESMAHRLPSNANILKTLHEFENSKKYEPEYLKALTDCFNKKNFKAA